MSDLEDFRLFCEQATTSQLEAIVEKEAEFEDTDDFRAACASIARAVLAGRA